MYQHLLLRVDVSMLLLLLLRACVPCVTRERSLTVYAYTITPDTANHSLSAFPVADQL